MTAYLRITLAVAALLLLGTQFPPQPRIDMVFTEGGAVTEVHLTPVIFQYSGAMAEAPRDGRWVRFFGLQSKPEGDVARWNGQYWGSPDGAFTCGSCDRWSDL